MKILLVEDDPDDLFFARHELERLGHRVVAVADGNQALVIYPQECPDLVITDIHMPGMDGFALTRAVQRCAAPRWQPVVFLSGHRDDDLQVKALEVGADGYIVKPVAARMLDARLKVIERLLLMQRQVEEHAAKLEQYYAAEEEEKRIAQHLIRRLVNVDKLDDPAIRHWIAPAAVFSGDFIAAARTPAGVLHVLLADASGHGLVASINVLPIVAPFYRMTEKGFGLDAIVREMNAKIRLLLPEDRFVAATLAAIDSRENYVRVWNGGNPPPVMLSEAGAVEHTFNLRHVPLGVLADGDLDVNAETRAFRDRAELAIYSDGMIGAEDENGAPFGTDALLATLAGASPGRRLDAAVAAVNSHLAGSAARDDLSIVTVECRNESEADAARLTSRLAPPASPGNWRFGLRLGAAEIRQIDVVPLMLGLAGQLDGARDRSGEIFVILSELYNNALDHGLLQLDSRLKLERNGMEAYLAERQSRLASLESGEIELSIELFEHESRGWLRISCRDSGKGFNHGEALVKASAASELPFGRGIALVRAMAASFEFNQAGNAVTAIVALGPDGAGADTGI